MVYFFSDAHLGSRAIPSGNEHQQAVVDLLNQMSKDATAIYLLGDIFDFWYEYLFDRPCLVEGETWKIPKSKRQYEPILRCLKALTDRGIAVHYFIGNHDIWTFGGLHQMTGVTIHKEPLSTELFGKQVFMAHGDGLVPQHSLGKDASCTMSKEQIRKVRAFMRLRAFFHHPVPQFIYRLLPPCIGDAFGYEWARRSRLKELAKPYPYQGEHKEELVLFAKEKEIEGPHRDYYIFGHRHIELDLMITKQSRIVILGDMFKQWTYATMNEKGELTLCTHEQNN